jgi:peptidoglycan/LPS O-acetylase OafA/YrhL
VVTKDKIVELESLRGLAALSVVLTHIPQWNAAFYANTFVRNAGEMVEFFFVLSGFVIALTYNKRITKCSDAVRFQFLRFGRLYPVHLLFLLVVASFEVIKLLFVRNPVSPPFEPGYTGPREFVENIFLVQGLGFSYQPSSFNGPSWTISTEFYTYALFAAVLVLAASRKNLIFFIFMSVTAALLIVNVPALVSFGRLFLCICGFFCGCLIAELSQRVKAKGIMVPAFVAPLSLIALIVYLSSAVFTAFWQSVVTFIFSAVIVLAIANGAEGRFRSALRWAPLAWLGTISYSVYMAHYSVIHVFNVATRRFVDMPTALVGGQPVAQLPAFKMVVVCSLLFAAILLVSAASYYLIERPFRDWSRQWVGANRPPQSGAI